MHCHQNTKYEEGSERKKRIGWIGSFFEAPIRTIQTWIRKVSHTTNAVTVACGKSRADHIITSMVKESGRTDHILSFHLPYDQLLRVFSRVLLAFISSHFLINFLTTQAVLQSVAMMLSRLLAINVSVQAVAYLE